MQRHQFLATVADNIPLCREHYRLILRVAQFPPTQPGQFIQIACRDANVEYGAEREIVWNRHFEASQHTPELLAPVALLRRPFSLAGRRDTRDGVELHIIHRVVGVGTEWMSQLQPGDQVDILGPLGNSFDLPSQAQLAVLVGGGVGIPPMLYLGDHLRGRRAIAFCGATTRDLIPLAVTDPRSPGDESVEPRLNVDELARNGIGTIITTDDGSFGFRGFVTQALEAWLDRHRTLDVERSMLNARSSIGSDEHRTSNQLVETIIYTCGPEPMMKRVAEIAAARGIECQIAVERAMACGMGTCQSCCIRVRKPDPAQPPLPGSDWCWRLACTDGPIFRGAELLW